MSFYLVFSYGLMCGVSHAVSLVEILESMPLVDGRSLAGKVLLDETPVRLASLNELSSREDFDEAGRLELRLENHTQFPLGKEELLSTISGLNQLACRLEPRALSFFTRVFLAGSIKNLHVPGMTIQRARASFFRAIYELRMQHIFGKTTREKQDALEQMHARLRSCSASSSEDNSGSDNTDSSNLLLSRENKKDR